MSDLTAQKPQNLILAHGFNVQDAGASTIDRLLPYLSEFSVQQADYGHFGVFGVRMYNKNISRVLAGMANPHSVGIGHSNGCPILVEAARLSPKITKLILINPALDVDTVFPETLESIIVLHNTHDEVVRASRWLPWHVWGQMGKVGYKGCNPKVRNYETFALFGVKGHSAVLHTKAKQLIGFLHTLKALTTPGTPDV